MSESYLDFEEQIANIELKVRELKSINNPKVNGPQLDDEITQLEAKAKKGLEDLYKNLSAWQKTLVARHPNRPKSSHFISALFTDFTPLHGDRYFKEDAAILSGIARLDDIPCVVLGQEKGTDTESRIKHNFGMARPEGYRKSVRLMKLANDFNMPVISFVDTSGAYPGVGAEERGQSEAIARSTSACLSLEQPNISIVIGEGGSGGAIALAATSKVFMLEHSIYSVISPEGAASILWRDPAYAKEAAEALKITAQDLKKLKVIDGIIPEPLGGAHRNHQFVFNGVKDAIKSTLKEFEGKSKEEIIKARRERFLNIGKNLNI